MQAHNPTDRLALTPCQQLIWRSQSASLSCPLFNQVVSISLATTDTPANVAARWAEAWTRVQHEHPILTARINIHSDGEARQFASGQTTVLETVPLPPMPGQSDGAFDHWVEQRKLRVFAPGTAMTDAAYVYHDTQAFIYLNLHHLLADAWSTVLIWQALQKHYNALGQGEADQFVADQRAADDTKCSATFFDYVSTTRWSDAVQPLSVAAQRSTQEFTPLAFYQHSNTEPDTHSTRVLLPLNDEEGHQIQSLNMGSNTTPVSAALHQMALHLTAFAVYLHRVSSDQTIVIEVPLLGRFSKRWLPVAGNFIEMMQVSIPVVSSSTLAEVYGQTNDALLNMLKQAQPGCTANLPTQSVHGVLNVITANNAEPIASEPANENTLRWHHTGHSDMRHPLRLHIADWNASGISSLELDINHAFFDTDQRTHVPAHLAAVYKAMLNDNSERVNTISLTTPAELWHLSGPGVKHATSTQTQSLYQRIVDIAHQYPNAIALSDAGQKIRYKDLIEQTWNVKTHLHINTIGQGDRVAVFMQRSLDLPVVLLGILASGAAYIPIDASQPMARVNAILANAQVRALIVDSSVQNHGPINKVPSTLLASELLIAPDTTSSIDVTVSEHKLVTPENTAYIMYTSGSTGVPKGVVVSHGALVSYLDWAQGYYSAPFTDVAAINMPLFTSVGFDLTVTSLYVPLLTGGTVHVYPQSENTDALSLFEVMRNPAINTIKLTPAHLALLLESDCRIVSAKQLIVGGEDLKNSTATAVQTRASHPLRIINEYGPTEAAVGCIAREWSAHSASGSVPIGLPISGMHAYLLNEQGQPQFEGVTGELFLAGDSLADGYWREPELTHTAFITMPAIPGKRLYRTGDLARIVNGELVYLGRQDTQVNINGYRVELSDIESALMEHPAISHCIVQVKSEAEERPAVEQLCSRCGLSSRSPDASVDESGVCSLCQRYAVNEQRIASYFRTPDDLQALVHSIQSRRRGKYDAVVLLSGGKDSTYALCQLVDLGLKVYAFSLDNGYLSDHALANIDTVCERLGVDHHFARTEHMDAIFNDSLTRYSNVCHGCFKTIYNLAMAFAAEHQIDTVFTGLSRGQLFETRLNNELFSDNSIPITHIDNMVLAARVQYHAIKDAPNTLLNIQAVNDGTLPKAVNIVDFYRYWHVEMSDMLAYLKSRIDWVRPPDTGRSTNCLINDVGIHVHKQERGFHNYALPYSWDVRLGHKEREEALEELDDDIDSERVDAILDKINYTVRIAATERSAARDATRIEALFTCISPLETSQLQRWLQEKLPAYMQPTRLSEVAQLPLNLHGKVDREKAFARSTALSDAMDIRVAVPLSPTESQVASLWTPYVATTTFHRDDNFFQLGGDSQAAIRCVMELRRQGYAIEPADLFKRPVLFRFAELLDNAERIADERVAAPAEKFSHLNAAQRDKLSRLLKRTSTNQAAQDS